MGITQVSEVGMPTNTLDGLEQAISGAQSTKELLQIIRGHQGEIPNSHKIDVKPTMIMALEEWISEPNKTEESKAALIKKHGSLRL